MMTKISSTSTELGYQLQQQQKNEHLYSNQLMISEDLKTMLNDETTMTSLQDHNSLKFPSLNTTATIAEENNHNARALQLALELSLVSLNCDQQNHSAHQHINAAQCLLLNTSNDHNSISRASNCIMTANSTQTLQNENHFQKTYLENTSLALGMIEERTKKSQNMTECVPVPSSEHVAEIVGRQGCKIKALRAKTNTYIKTPVRGEEPVFVVTGRKEDVAKAKREILSAAEHFSLIRAARNPSSRQTFTTNASPILPTINDSDFITENLLEDSKTTMQMDASIFKLNETNDKQNSQQQQQITIQVRVPYRVVGLVVGPKGSTIKHIQQETQTYIVTPSREKQPIFEVTGSHENVQLARKQIEAHIAIRTGNLSTSLPPPTTTPTTFAGSRIQKQKLCKNIEIDEIEYEKNVCLYRSDHNTEEITLNEYLNDMTTMSSATSTSTAPAGSSETTICTINSLSQMLNEGENLQPEILETFYRTFDYKENNVQQMRQQHQQHHQQRPQQAFKVERSNTDIFYSEQEQQMSQFLKAQQKQLQLPTSQTSMSTTTTTTMAALLNFNARSSSSASSSTSSKSAQNCYIAVGDNCGSENGVSGGFATNWKHNLGDSLDTDEGISESSLIWVLPTTSSASTTTTLTQSINYVSTTTTNTTSTAISPTDSLLCHSSSSSNEIQHQNNSQNIFYTKSQQQFKRDSCLICGYQEVSAALIPCGHDLFCLDCAQHICSSLEPNCPICNNNVYQAVRITS